MAVDSTPTWMILAIAGVVLVIMAVLSIAVLGFFFRGRRQAWKPPERSGPATSIRTINSRDVPSSPNASWRGDELEVRSEREGTVNLFNVPLPDLEQQVILYRFRLKAESLKSAVFGEMWCHVAGKGKFFSKGLDQKVSTTDEWHVIEIPFYLGRGQQANLLNLNLVFGGSGTVRLKEIEIQSAPVKET